MNAEQKMLFQAFKEEFNKFEQSVTKQIDSLFKKQNEKVNKESCAIQMKRIEGEQAKREIAYEELEKTVTDVRLEKLDKATAWKLAGATSACAATLIATIFKVTEFILAYLKARGQG